MIICPLVVPVIKWVSLSLTITDDILQVGATSSHTTNGKISELFDAIVNQVEYDGDNMNDNLYELSIFLFSVNQEYIKNEINYENIFKIRSFEIIVKIYA